MKELVAVIFGLGLGCNALLFVPQVLAVWRKKSDEGISLITFGGFSVLQAIGIVHGVYQRDLSLILGMAASLLTCGSVTALTVFYRVRRMRAEGVSR
jgi:MtN3 and saliva related transmembrane protein